MSRRDVQLRVHGPRLVFAWCGPQVESFMRYLPCVQQSEMAVGLGSFDYEIHLITCVCVCVQIYFIECTHRHGNFHVAILLASFIAERFRLVRCRVAWRVHDQGLARLGLATLALGTTKSGSK